MVRAVMARAAPQERGRAPSSRRLIAAAPPEEQLVPAIAPDGADLKPIERIVIQVDEPPAARPVERETVTHITIIAAGDLKAPDAAFTIIKTEKEEAHP
jgi:hypothetical protein